MRILMVGLGGIGQRHLRNLRLLLGDELEVMAIRHLNRSHTLTNQLQIEEGVNLIEKYNVNVYADLEQALGHNPDSVFICNPTSLHIPIALDAARAGCNLFIEKPLSHDFSGVEELIDLVEQGKLKAVVGYQMRFHPCLMHLRNLVEQRAIGKFLSVRAEVGDYMPAWHSYEDYRNLYASKKDLGGGVVLTQIHELDYLFWLFGMPRSLFALGGHLSRLEMDVEDTADVLMECFVDEQTLPVSMHMDYLQRPSARGCVIVGDQGRAVMDLVSPCVTLLDSSGRLVESVHYDSYDRNQSFLDEVKCFLEYTHGAEQKSLVTLREAVQSLKIALAVKKSLQTNSMINFKYD